MSRHRLTDAQQIALAVTEPGCAFGASHARIVPRDLCDSVDRGHPGKLVRLEHEPSSSQIRNHGVDVVDLERDLRVFSGRLSGRLEERELAARELIAESPGTLFRRLQPELLGVERPRALEILCGKTDGDGGSREDV
jgi:hypothetical protein